LFRIVLISLDSGALSVLFALLHFITLPLFRFQRFSFAFPHLVVCVVCVCGRLKLCYDFFICTCLPSVCILFFIL